MNLIFQMKIGILKEKSPEKRVVLLPEHIKTLADTLDSILVETTAGIEAGASDIDYSNAGAVVKSREEVFAEAEVLFFINPLHEDEIKRLKADKILVGIVNPLQNTTFVKMIKEQAASLFSLDMVPRITRAQSMDVLSSQATVAGYKAVLKAAFMLPRFFPMFMSAAGTIKPAKVLVLGAGVAGLQAISVARKLGAVVEVFDVRSAVKEEVLSLGAKFVEVEGATEDKNAGGYAVEQTEEFKQKQAQLIHDKAIGSDVIICTAQIPGREAPKLVKAETIEAMKAGSVIIDLAASTGGNCALTENNSTTEKYGVTIVGESNFPSKMPVDASSMLGKNMLNFLQLMITEEGKLNLDFKDEIIAGSCITKDGDLINERVKNIINS